MVVTNVIYGSNDTYTDGKISEYSGARRQLGPGHHQLLNPLINVLIRFFSVLSDEK